MQHGLVCFCGEDQRDRVSLYVLKAVFNRGKYQEGQSVLMQ